MSLEINGMKSQTKTVTMEAECWQEPKPEVYSGGQMLKHIHRHREALKQIYGVISGPTKKRSHNIGSDRGVLSCFSHVWKCMWFV